MARVHEHLVDAGALGHDVHGAVVMHGEAVVALERGVQVGDHPHLPVAALADRLERGWCGLLVTGAERAWPALFEILQIGARGEVGRALGPLGDDGDPPPRQLVQPHLTHNGHQDRARFDQKLTIAAKARSGRSFVSCRMTGQMAR